MEDGVIDLSIFNRNLRLSDSVVLLASDRIQTAIYSDHPDWQGESSEKIAASRLWLTIKGADKTLFAKGKHADECWRRLIQDRDDLITLTGNDAPPTVLIDQAGLVLAEILKESPSLVLHYDDGFPGLRLAITNVDFGMFGSAARGYLEQVLKLIGDRP
jgi:hypothetical protein